MRNVSFSRVLVDISTCQKEVNVLSVSLGLPSSVN